MLEQQQVPVENQLESQQSSLEQHSSTGKQEDDALFVLPPQAETLVAGYVSSVEDGQQSGTRARLMELIAVYGELDATPEAAAHSAIQQMENERLAMQKRQAAAQQQAFQQRRQTRTAPQSARSATLLAMKWFGGAALATTALCTLSGATTNLCLYLLMMFSMFGLPMVIGTAVGLRAEKRPAMGSFYALALLFPLKMLLDLMTMHTAGYGWDGLAWMMVDFVLFWMPLGCLAAGLTGWGATVCDAGITGCRAHPPHPPSMFDSTV